MSDELNDKLDLIIEMLLTQCGRNLEISFSETQAFDRKFKELKKQSCTNKEFNEPR